MKRFISYLLSFCISISAVFCVSEAGAVFLLISPGAAAQGARARARRPPPGEERGNNVPRAAPPEREAGPLHVLGLSAALPRVEARHGRSVQPDGRLGAASAMHRGAHGD